ncbi:MAG: RagB/SusD family nutrient uptake outer membrane protein [Sphingobacteriales bacterium]|nr:MAG: RagB/SusD family nutrient uptake outer membrane protein [Sphingobacteriales bacterium]
MKSTISKMSLVLLLGVTVVIACNRRLEVLDENNPTSESYFKTAGELQNGVNSVYSILRSGNMLAREWYTLHDMRGGEYAAGGPQLEAPRAQLLKEVTPAATNSVMTSIWNGSYHMINRANQVLAKGPDVTDNPGLRDRVMGEAKFLRAWAYFELVSQWGDVPVYTKPITSPTDFEGKTPAAEIYNLIVTDLTEAAQALPPSYGSADNGRATSGAATALLGRVLIQKGDYNAARTALLTLVGKYSLVDNYQWNFDGDVRNDDGTAAFAGHEFNSESIFEVVFVDRGDGSFNWGYTGEGSTSALANARTQDWGKTWGNVIPSNRLLNEYEPNDPRYKFTIWEEGDMILTQSTSQAPQVLKADDINTDVSNKNGSVKKRFFRKYNIYDWVNSGNHFGGLNQRLLRYADVLLMLAECEAEVGTPSQAAAYINQVRARPSVNMPPVNPATKEAAIRAVIHERWVELAAEEIINIDVLRWKKQGYYPTLVPDPRPGQIDMLPIPASEISANPKLQ